MPGRNSDPTGMFGYQGQERVSNSTNDVGGSRWYNFQLRMYNPALGRFNTIDPYSQFNSPYLAMANNPISYVDPDGGKAVEMGGDWARKKRHLEYLRRLKEWWRENGKRFRSTDKDGGNFFYHTMNLQQFGVSDFDAIDITTYGDQGIYGNGWGPVIKEVMKLDNLTQMESFAAQSVKAQQDMVESMIILDWNNKIALQREALDALANADGVILRQEGSEKSDTDPITSIYSDNGDGTKTILWDITDGTSWSASYNSTQVAYTNGFDEIKFEPYQNPINNKTIGDKIVDYIADDWNSDATRMQIPDAYSLGINLSYIIGYGVSTTAELVVPTRGRDALIPKVVINPAQGVGLNLGVGIEVSQYKFTGEVEDFNHKSFLGTTYSGDIDLGLKALPIGLGGSWSPGDHGGMIGTTMGVGLGFGASFSWGDPFNP